MSTKKSHGVSIGASRQGEHVFIRFTAHGKLTKEDYEAFSPMIDAAIGLAPQSNARVLADLRNFDGIGLDAVWQEFKLARNHQEDFQKIAVITDSTWQEMQVNIAKWFAPGKVETFQDEESAEAWLTS